MSRTREIFEPPYLFQGPRPTITTVAAQWKYGQKVKLRHPDAASIATVSLAASQLDHPRLRHESAVRPRSASPKQAAAHHARRSPTAKNKGASGHYMVFILNADGVPSVARIIRIA